MGIIGIEIPDINEQQDIEVQVIINGKRQTYKYRVEFFYWNDCPDPKEHKVDCLKHIVSGYDSGWQLSQIGLPTEAYIPVTFKQKN
ncbi:hypothetical protein [Marinoscillum sp. MHG1-6]|uniref:hypothetical protein n=1 Tax=Marinoscillum sp. MHG1-6 TaxID=2959627 RepID=UPI00215750B2|nr:hypothetical protein [Marinoscillum sp. MHG1-6]